MDASDNHYWSYHSLGELLACKRPLTASQDEDLFMAVVGIASRPTFIAGLQEAGVAVSSCVVALGGLVLVFLLA